MIRALARFGCATLVVLLAVGATVEVAVSATTAFGTTKNVLPVIVAVIGKTALLLEKAVYPGRPPVTVKVVGKSANRFAVLGETVSANPALTVAFAVADAFAASRTVISTTVSAATALAITVKVEPVTAAVIGSTALLLENAV